MVQSLSGSIVQSVDNSGFGSKFDRNLAASASGDADNASRLTEVEERGRSLFVDGVGGVNEFACQMYHVPPTFNMETSHNIGLDLKYRDRGLGALNRKSNDPFAPSNDGKLGSIFLAAKHCTVGALHARWPFQDTGRGRRALQ